MACFTSVFAVPLGKLLLRSCVVSGNADAHVVMIVTMVLHAALRAL
jgi:hypothetical protein